MANEMTAREQRFAALLLETTKVDAYGQAGYSQKGSRATQTVDAYRLSKRPKVQREVARLLQQRAFPADDYKRLQETAIAGLTEMFLYDANSRVRLKAGSMLLAYADAGLKLHPEPSAKERAYDEITKYVEDAARKHREALEREPEQALIVEAAEEEAEPLVEVATKDAPPAKSAAEFLEEIRREPPMEAEAPKPPAPQVRYIEKLVSRPGHFPAQFERVLVRKSEGAED
jgi:hypothetical protein